MNSLEVDLWGLNRVVVFNIQSLQFIYPTQDCLTHTQSTGKLQTVYTHFMKVDCIHMS